MRYYCLHFIDEKTEAHRVKRLARITQLVRVDGRIQTQAHQTSKPVPFQHHSVAPRHVWNGKVVRMARINHLPGAFLQGLRRNKMCHGDILRNYLCGRPLANLEPCCNGWGPSCTSYETKTGVIGTGLPGVSFQEKRWEHWVLWVEELYSC